MQNRRLRQTSSAHAQRTHTHPGCDDDDGPAKAVPHTSSSENDIDMPTVRYMSFQAVMYL